MDSVTITLSSYDILCGSNTGILRVVEDLRLKRDWSHNFKGTIEEKMAKSISGCWSEICVARYLEIPFTFHVNHFTKPDLIFHDLHLQVRSQERKVQGNHLILRPTSKKNEIYILVIAECPDFHIQGFINSSNVLGTKKYLTDFNLPRPKCHAVPIEDLTPIHLLKTNHWN